MLGIGASKAVVGLDVGSYAVKAVALQANRDRITLQGYAQARIGDQDVGEVIRTVLGQLGLKAKRLVTSVSGRSVIVRQVETPKLPENELKAHIAYEADKYIPFGSEEVIIDCQPIPPRDGAEQPNQQVMLVAVRKSFIQEHLAQLRAAHVVPEAIDVDVFALANAYELLGPPMPPDSEKKAIALIDIGASKSNIAILQAGRVLFTREIYLAGNEISDAIARTLNENPEDVDRIKLAPGEALDAIIDAAMPAFEDLANEIRLSFDYVEGQFDAEVATAVLTGGSAQLPNAGDILGNILGRPVHVFDPMAGLDLVPSKYDIHGLDANSPSLTVALGLAAHILEHPSRGLGGQQSLAWQPRSRSADAGDAAAMAMAGAAVAAGEAMAEPEAPAEQQPEDHSGTAVTQMMPPEEPAFAPPPPIASTPTGSPVLDMSPEEEQEPAPPVAIPAPLSVTPVDLDENSDEDLDALSVGEVGTSTAKHRSTLLVVLEDDQEMPKSDRFEVQRSSPINVETQIGTSKLVNPGRIEDEPKTDSDIQLPNLPNLPKP